MASPTPVRTPAAPPPKPRTVNFHSVQSLVGDTDTSPEENSESSSQNLAVSTHHAKDAGITSRHPAMRLSPTSLQTTSSYALPGYHPPPPPPYPHLSSPPLAVLPSRHPVVITPSASVSPGPGTPSRPASPAGEGSPAAVEGRGQESDPATRNGGTDDGSKKGRTIYKTNQVLLLESTFHQTRYPEPEMIEALSRRLNVPENKIKVWFQNKRARWRRRNPENLSCSSPPPPPGLVYRRPSPPQPPAWHPSLLPPFPPEAMLELANFPSLGPQCLAQGAGAGAAGSLVGMKLLPPSSLEQLRHAAHLYIARSLNS